jgi:PKD repeat protein
MGQLMLSWNSSMAYYENQLSASDRNLSQFKALQFRAGVDFVNSVSGKSLNFSVELHNVNGDTQTVKVADLSNALFFPPGAYPNLLPKIIQNSIKIPLSKFNKISHTNIDAIRFLFNKSVAGSIFISDLILSSDSVLQAYPVASFQANTQSTCDGMVAFTDSSLNTPTKWKWYFGNGDTSMLQNPTYTYPANGSYTVKLVVANSIGKDSSIKAAYVVVNRPASPLGTDDARCGGGVVNLSANASGGGTLAWYNASSGGSVVNTGSSYSPNLSGTTIFYVQENLPGATVSGGIPDNTVGGGSNYTGNQWLYFDVFKKCKLKSVDVYANGAGDRTFELWDASNSVLQTLTVNLAGGKQTVVLNFPLIPGSNYSLRLNSSSTTDLYRNNFGVSYPYTISNLVSITTSSASPNPENYYYFFYNWVVETQSCVSSRAAVTGTINVCAGISNSSSDHTLNIYPNPAQNTLMIEKSADGDKVLVVDFVNLVGQKIYSSVIENNNGDFRKNLDIEKIPVGVYFIYLKTGDKHWVYKLVKE